MANIPINIGLSANDHTGDPLRTAYDKINKSFSFVERWMGDWDMSGNLLPSGIGSGISGIVQAGNKFRNTGASTTLTTSDGVSLMPVGLMMMAVVDNPSTTDISDWIFWYSL